MNYFNIQPIQITINNPFDFRTIIAIKWVATNVPRGGSEASTFICSLIDDNQIEVYNWPISIPANVINTWLDDAVIDNYICSTDSRFVKI